MNKFMSAADAVALIRDGDTVGLMGGGGGLMEASCLFEAVQARYLQTQHPQRLTVIHALGIGDKKTKGMNCFAHEGLVKRVVGGHWVWSPAMQQLAEAEKIEAYILPGGVSSQLMREIGAGRPGLFTHVGLGTVCDPRLSGGKMNASAQEDLSEVVQMDGREYLRYKPFPIHVALVRASAADEDGNISFEHEAANLDSQSLALAARNSGGKVIVQVKERLPRGALKAREVRIPAAWVDAIVVDPDQRTSYGIPFDPALSGELHGQARLSSEAADQAAEQAQAAEQFSERQAIARRAALELFNTDKERPVVNYGVGVPDAVAKLLSARGEMHRIYQTIEHGTYGGTLLDGVLFGYARNASAYGRELDTLHRQIKAGFAAIPKAQRKVISSHDSFHYFGDAYDVVFLAPQGISSSAEPSARDVAGIIRQIRAEKIKAIFFENALPQQLARQIASETGVKISGKLYADVLGDDVRSYAQMMRHNYQTILGALK